MTNAAPQTLAPGIVALDGERFEVALDSHKGLLDRPAGSGGLTLTTHRAIRPSSSGQRTTIMVLSLHDVGSAELIQRSNLAKGLAQAGVLFAAAAVLGGLSWLVFEAALFTVPLAGIPIFMAIFILSEHLLGGSKSELLLYTAGAVLRQPLLSGTARRDAPAVLHRLFALKHGIEPEDPPAGAPVAALRDTPVATAPFGWTPVPPLERTLPA